MASGSFCLAYNRTVCSVLHFLSHDEAQRATCPKKCTSKQHRVVVAQALLAVSVHDTRYHDGVII